MTDSPSSSDGGLKTIPIAEFEGEFVRQFEGRLPALTLDMPEGYTRGTHLLLAVEVRVRNVSYVEDKRGDLTRHHVFALEEISLKEAFDPATRPNNVGGTSAGDAWAERLLDYLHGDVDELDLEEDEIPPRLRELLAGASREPAPAPATIPTGVEIVAMPWQHAVDF